MPVRSIFTFARKRTPTAPTRSQLNAIVDSVVEEIAMVFTPLKALLDQDSTLDPHYILYRGAFAAENQSKATGFLHRTPAAARIWSRVSGTLIYRGIVGTLGADVAGEVRSIADDFVRDTPDFLGWPALPPGGITPRLKELMGMAAVVSSGDDSLRL